MTCGHSFALSMFRGPGRTRRRPARGLVFAAMVAVVGVTWTGNASRAQDAPPKGFSDVVSAQMPAVVNIATTQEIPTSTAPGLNLPEGSRLDEFLKDFFGNRMPEGETRKARALGSGFIISAEGHVVTNAHVVDKASEIQVVLQDDRTIDAKLIGSDPATDLALLKIEAAGPLPHVEWGDPDRTKVGDWVIAIGNPFGLGGSVSVGVLSARSRDIQAGPYDDFLQTDAPINSGNSGGPLFDRRGKVIGVNTVILSPSGGNIGIGFAIPASTAEPIIAQLRESGRVERGWLGVQIQPVTDGVAKALDLKDTDGVLVASVNEGSPAAKAGVQAGDIIRSFGGRRIGKMRDLPRMVANTPIGTEVPVKVLRDGADKVLQVTVGRKPDGGNVAAAEPAGRPEAKGRAFGMALSDVSPRAREKLGLKGKVTGALVTDVRRGSPAAEEGIRPGDVIVSVGKEKVSSAAQAAKALASASRFGGKPILLRINRGGDYLFVALQA
ncbi:MAG: Do family serine endopeptidase [Alphaproteobacteria bacterium]|nr:Do family serine endopeptidase [Alphaproteobacteria bacterium]